MEGNLVHTSGRRRAIFGEKCKSAPGGRGVKITQPLRFEEWADLLEGFSLMENTIQFIIGDLLAYGSKKYEPREYDQALRLTGKSIKTLQNWAWVCLAIPPEERTYDLTFHHYEQVAALEPELQDEYLNLAASTGLSVHRFRHRIRRDFPSSSKPDRFGKPLQIKGLGHAPINEQGVVFLFGILCESLGFYVEAVKQSFPDCIAKRRIGKKRAEEWERVRIEFEFASSDFKRHRHNPKGCDLIVCWVDDWKDCPLEVLELEKCV